MLLKLASELNDKQLYLIALELEKKGALGLFETFNAAKSGIKGLGQTIVNTAEKAGAKNLANTLGHDIGQSVAKGQKLLGYKAKDFSGNIVNLGIDWEKKMGPNAVQHFRKTLSPIYG